MDIGKTIHEPVMDSIWNMSLSLRDVTFYSVSEYINDVVYDSTYDSILVTLSTSIYEPTVISI
jgi:hypothetical protein